IRAKNALGDAAKKARQQKQSKEGDNLSGYPSLIINNGLLATLAFSLYKGDQHERIADAIADHLHKVGILATTEAPSARKLLDHLCNGSDSKLQRATRETLQYLAYLKRF